MKRLAALLAALALLAGCGGGGNGDGGGNGGTGPSRAGGEVEDELAHNMGFQQCDGYSVNDLAATYNTEKTADAVAEAVARTTPAQPESREAIKQGCLDGLKK
jgi:oligopeptide transport system substrate-binding protein